MRSSPGRNSWSADDPRLLPDPFVLSAERRDVLQILAALIGAPQVAGLVLGCDERVRAAASFGRAVEVATRVPYVWLKERFTAILVTHDVGEGIALADRILLLERGAVPADIPVDLPRPRHRGDPAFGALEERILARLLARLLDGA